MLELLTVDTQSKKDKFYPKKEVKVGKETLDGPPL